MAGAYIAIGAALCTVVGTGVAPHLGAGAARLLSAAVFPVGLIAIILTGMELFTGDAMLGPLAVLQGKVGWAKVLKNCLVYPATVGLVYLILWSCPLPRAPLQAAL